MRARVSYARLVVVVMIESTRRSAARALVLGLALPAAEADTAGAARCAARSTARCCARVHQPTLDVTA